MEIEREPRKKSKRKSSSKNSNEKRLNLDEPQPHDNNKLLKNIQDAKSEPVGSSTDLGNETQDIIFSQLEKICINSNETQIKNDVGVNENDLNVGIHLDEANSIKTNNESIITSQIQEAPISPQNNTQIKLASEICDIQNPQLHQFSYPFAELNLIKEDLYSHQTNLESAPIDEGEEAISILPNSTAPQNISLESGDFFNLTPISESINSESKTIHALTDSILQVRPRLVSHIKSCYKNYLLETNKEYVQSFLSSLQPSYDGFELFELMSNYLRATNHLIGAEKSLNVLKENCDKYEKGVWSLATKQLTQHTSCNDGTSLVANYEIHTAQFNKSTFNLLKRTLKDIKELLKDSFSLYSYSVQLCITQIQHYLHKSFGKFNSSNCQIFTNQDLRPLLRTSLAILFHFLRKPLLHPSLLNNTKIWTQNLAAILLRIATIDDHLFLLNHVLRLPPRVVGKFGASLIQIPPIPIPIESSEYLSSFTHLHVDYALNFLLTILSSVEKRTEILNHYSLGLRQSSISSPNDPSSQWVLVDSDGEDEPEAEGPYFKETDLIALLQQVPFDKVFKRALLIYTEEDEDAFDVSLYTDEKALELMSFCSHLIETLALGLRNYENSRYAQFSKLLSRLLLHTLQYATDFIEFSPNIVQERHKLVKEEYDLLVLQDVKCFKDTHQSAQFLASIPFHLVSSGMLWEIYRFLTHWEYDESRSSSSWDVSSLFLDELQGLNESSAYYLLTTLSNMALAREGENNEFVKLVTLHLFQIGFLSPVTRESCSKTARDLLGSLTKKYPNLISNLLQTIRHKMKVLDDMSLFLLRELALDCWVPEEEDINLLSHWILDFHTLSLENTVCRTIISSMNWDYKPNGELFLPYKIHLRVGILVVDAHFKWENVQSMISEGMKKISSYISKYPDFSSWAWDIIFRIHLHAFDRFKNPSMPIASFKNITENLPNFERDSELERVKKALEANNPIAVCATLLMTNYGHSLPLICSNGFDLLDILIKNSKFKETIMLLFYIIPSFICAKDSLLSNEKFSKILNALLIADQTYMRMAKRLISEEFPGTCTKIFGDMLLTQMQEHNRFRCSSKQIVLFWTEILTKIPNWNKDKNVLYLLEVVAKYSYSREKTKASFEEYFMKLYKEMPTNSSSGITNFLLNWSSTSSSSSTLLPNATYPLFPYLVYTLLKIERDLEISSGFWKSLCSNLSNPKNSVETAIKKSANSTKYSTNSSYLTIYRWALHATQLPFSHILLISYWQQFFLKYFHRSDSNESYTQRLFEGATCNNILKGCKRSLHDLLEYYQKELRELENEKSLRRDEQDSTNSSFTYLNLKKRHELVRAMTLWIEDPQFHEESLYIPALPPQYLPIQLHSLFQGDFKEWSEYLDLDELKEELRKRVHDYMSLINRSSWDESFSAMKSPGRKISLSLGLWSKKEEFLKRLNSYDVPVEPPPLPSFSQVIPSTTPDMFTNVQAMERKLKPHLKCLGDFAQKFSLEVSKHTALNCAYLENFPDLYTEHETEALVNVNCSEKKFYPCSGPAHVIFKFTEARLNERVGHIIHQNRTEYHNLISGSSVQSPPLSLSVAAVYIEDFITNLVLKNNSTTKEDNSGLFVKMGSELFYLIVERIGEDSNFYPPTRQLYSSFLEILGSHFISFDASQCERLVRKSILNPFLIGSLAPHISFINTTPPSLLRIYEQVTNIPPRESDLAFVILSKLDIGKWLEKNKKIDIEDEEKKLVGLIWKALCYGNGREGMVNEIYRSHFKIILSRNLKSHYFDILNLLLADSDKENLPPQLWYDFFNSLTRDSVKFSLKMDPFIRKKEIKRFSIELSSLSHVQLLETAVLLSGYFRKDRLTHGLYGLYPKFRNFVEPISTFVQIICFSIISSSLKYSNGAPAYQVVESLWPIIIDIYSPWIIPYEQGKLGNDCAHWIQQMNFEAGSLLLPWISSDISYASLFVNDFTDSVLFIAETLPGCPLLFSNLWNFYADNYASTGVKDHVLNLVNNCFISIPWAMFWPSYNDMESLNRVVEKYLPSCHSLMSVIFAQVNWREWLEDPRIFSPAIKNRCLGILLNLTVHLATDILARESPTWTSVMENIESLNWENLQPSSLEPVLNWFVMSIDPRVVLSLDVLHHLDKSSFELLLIASGYSRRGTEINRSISKLDLNKKRYFFTRSYARLIVSVSTKHKNLLVSHSVLFEKSVQNIMNSILAVAKEENQERNEFSGHLKEILGLISNHNLSTIVRNGALTWFQLNTNIPLPFIYESIQILFSLKVPSYTTVPLIEAVIPLVFRHPEGNWSSVAELVIVPESIEYSKLLEISSKDGHFLVLYTLLLTKEKTMSNGGLHSISHLTELLKNMKPKESNEAALPLIYGIFIRISIALHLSASNHIGGAIEKGVKKFLNSLIMHLMSLGDDKQGWMLLGVLGLTKSSLLSTNGRLFARGLSMFLMAQIPSNGPIRTRPDSKGHWTQLSDDIDIKEHTELSNALIKLEELKTGRNYLDHLDVIEFLISKVKDPLENLNTVFNFIKEMNTMLFSDRFLL